MWCSSPQCGHLTITSERHSFFNVVASVLMRVEIRLPVAGQMIVKSSVMSTSRREKRPRAICTPRGQQRVSATWEGRRISGQHKWHKYQSPKGRDCSIIALTQSANNVVVIVPGLGRRLSTPVQGGDADTASRDAKIGRIVPVAC